MPRLWSSNPTLAATARRLTVVMSGSVMRKRSQPAPFGVAASEATEHLHVGVEDPFAPARKAHPALRVDDLDALAARLDDVTWDDAIPGTRRFYSSDPFGNRLEFLEH